MLKSREIQGERVGKRGVEIDINGKYIGVGTISLTLYKRAKKEQRQLIMLLIFSDRGEF